MGRRVFESQSRDCPARGRVSIGSAVALEMIQDDKTFCARFECACGFVELVIARVWCEIPLEPGNHGSGGCLSALDDRLARIDRIHVCAPHTGLVNWALPRHPDARCEEPVIIAISPGSVTPSPTIPMKASAPHCTTGVSAMRPRCSAAVLVSGPIISSWRYHFLGPFVDEVLKLERH